MQRFGNVLFWRLLGLRGFLPLHRYRTGRRRVDVASDNFRLGIGDVPIFRKLDHDAQRSVVVDPILDHAGGGLATEHQTIHHFPKIAFRWPRRRGLKRHRLGNDVVQALVVTRMGAEQTVINVGLVHHRFGEHLVFFEHVDCVDHCQRVVPGLCQKFRTVGIGFEFLLTRAASNGGGRQRVAQVLHRIGIRAEHADPTENVT